MLTKKIKVKKLNQNFIIIFRTFRPIYIFFSCKTKAKIKKKKKKYTLLYLRIGYDRSLP